MRTRRKGRELSEPSLNEMLDDPVVQVVMGKDVMLAGFCNLYGCEIGARGRHPC